MTEDKKELKTENQRLEAVKVFLEKNIQLGHFEHASFEGKRDNDGKLFAYVEKEQYRFRLSHLFSSDENLRGKAWVIRTVSQKVKRAQMPDAEFLKRICNHESPDKKEVHLVLHDNWHTNGFTNVGRVVYDLLFTKDQVNVLSHRLPSEVNPADVPLAKAALLYLGGIDTKTRLSTAIEVLKAVEEKRESPKDPAIQTARCANCNGSIAFCGFKVSMHTTINLHIHLKMT